MKTYKIYRIGISYKRESADDLGPGAIVGGSTGYLVSAANIGEAKDICFKQFKEDNENYKSYEILKPTGREIKSKQIQAVKEGIIYL